MTLNKINIGDLCTWVFVLSFFVIEIKTPGGRVPLFSNYVEAGIIACCGLAAVTLTREGVRKAKRLIWLLLTIALSQCLYAVAFYVDPILGTFEGYMAEFGRLYLYITVVLIYSLLFYKEHVFIEFFYKVGKWILIVGLFALLLYEISGQRYLLDFGYGLPRPQVFFTEPSAAAPAVVAIALLAHRKRQWFFLLVAVAFMLAAKSPTVLLVCASSVLGVYYLTRKSLKVLFRSVFLTAFAATAFTLLGGVEWITRPDVMGGTFHRLSHGIEYALTLSARGYNPRFARALEVFEHMSMNNLYLTGYGLNSAAEYFSHVYIDSGFTVRDASLFLTILFSYGIVGFILFYAASAVAAYRMARSRSPYLFVFMPFLMASIINSAQGFVAYKFVILGLIVYLLRSHYGR